MAAFNFGIAGGGSLTELLNWSRLGRDGIRPNLLLVEVLPALFSSQLPSLEFDESFLPADRLGWQDLPLIKRYAGNDRTGLRRDWYEAWPLAGYSSRFSLLNLVGPDFLPPAYRLGGDKDLDQYGAPRFLDVPVTSQERLRATEYAHQDYAGRFAVFHLGGAQCTALRELLASCRREGVPVALVITPEGPTFRSWYPPETWRAIEEWLTEISREYDAPLVNAREWIDDEGDFLDSHHLLASGSAKFMDRLGREAIVPPLAAPGVFFALTPRPAGG